MAALDLCGKPLTSRSKFKPRGGHRCYQPKSHKGKCSEYPYLAHLKKYAPRVEKKIVALFGPIVPNATTCLVCKKPIGFALFQAAQRGKSEIETSHGNPRLHTADNIGFAHRACNIAQGNKTLEEFYDWIAEILLRVGYAVAKRL